MAWYDGQGVFHEGRKPGSETAMDRYFANVRAGLWSPTMQSYCLLWVGKLNHEGYAQMGWISLVDKQQHSTGHLFAYERFVGPIPEGFQVDHLCRVRNCVASWHLEAVTPRENLLRGNTFQALNVAKTQCPEGHPYDKANTYVWTDGSRHCRTCARATSAAIREEAGGDPFWMRVKQDPEKLAAHRAYKREWAKQKRARQRSEG